MQSLKCRLSIGALIVLLLSVPASSRAEDPRVPGCGRAVVKHADELCFPDAKMTVEAWVRPEERSKGKWMRILSKYGHKGKADENLALRGWELSLTDAGVVFFRATPASEDHKAPWVGIQSKAAVPLHQWTHVACVLDGPGKALRFYLNGKLDTEKTVDVKRLQINPPQKLCIGVYGGYDVHFFKGLIDEIRLTADALRFDGPPAKPYTGKDAGTVALYHFDRQEPGGFVLNAVDPEAYRLELLDGNLPTLAPAMPGFGKALRLTGVRESGLAFKPTRAKQIPHPSLDELGELGQAWAKRYPKRIKADVLGRVSDGLPVHRFTITDFGVPDDDKEIVLMAGMHVGGEISGGTSLMAFAEWLIGDDPTAARMRSRQVCVIVPVANPYGYAKTACNKWRHDTAWCWSPNGATFPEENPEGVLIQKLIDELKPDVFVDSHGTGLMGQYMGELLGTSGYSLLLNTFQASIVREMARAAGFPQHLGSETHEKVLVSEAVPGCPHEFFVYIGGNTVNATTYAYIRYHTIPMTMESGGWAGSAVARLKRLMEIGCERWPTEPYAGYPNRRISSATTWMQWLAAYGRTAKARRASRVELWQKQKQLVRFASYPDTDGAFLFGVATTPEAAQQVFRSPMRGGGRITVGRFLLNLSQMPDVDAKAIRAYAEETGVLTMRCDPRLDADVEAEPIRHGLALRSMIPYADPKILEVRLNGRPIGVSETDGYQIWHGNGGTYLQVNIPPEKVGGLALVTCRYDGREKREWGFTPKPIPPAD